MPRVKLTTTTRIALYSLRFYLIFLMLLLAFSFLKTIRSKHQPNPPVPGYIPA